MIIVTGTKRSGTSMWMQILVAAGFPAFGEAFPGAWGSALREANPSGFFESLLCDGIYHRTNPHPETGDYFFPEQVRRHVAKVFAHCLARSDRAFIGRVVATLRPFREYASSLARLYDIEHRERLRRRPGARRPAHVPAALEWWNDNYTLIRDVAVRRYPIHFQSYEGLLADPDKVIRATLAWLGHGDATRAVAAVKPEHRTQRQSSDAPTDVEPRFAEVFDELYATLHAGRALDAAFIAKLNDTHRAVAPLIDEHVKLVREDQARREAEEGPGEAERTGCSSIAIAARGPAIPAAADYATPGCIAPAIGTRM